MPAIGTSPSGPWTRRNTILTLCSAITLVAAIEVILFGVIWTHGVYGSRMAWLGGVVLPLLIITSALAWAGARPGSTARDGGTVADSSAGAVYRDRRSAPRAIGITSLVLVGSPLAFALLLLLTYILTVVTHRFA